MTALSSPSFPEKSGGGNFFIGIGKKGGKKKVARDEAVVSARSRKRGGKKVRGEGARIFRIAGGGEKVSAWHLH